MKRELLVLLYILPVFVFGGWEFTAEEFDEANPRLVDLSRSVYWKEIRAVETEYYSSDDFRITLTLQNEAILAAYFQWQIHKGGLSVDDEEFNASLDFANRFRPTPNSFYVRLAISNLDWPNNMLYLDFKSLSLVFAVGDEEFFIRMDSIDELGVEEIIDTETTYFLVKFDVEKLHKFQNADYIGYIFSDLNLAQHEFEIISTWQDCRDLERIIAREDSRFAFENTDPRFYKVPEEPPLDETNEEWQPQRIKEDTAQAMYERFKTIMVPLVPPTSDLS